MLSLNIYSSDSQVHQSFFTAFEVTPAMWFKKPTEIRSTYRVICRYEHTTLRPLSIRYLFQLSFLIACSLGFPTSVSTFSRISALAGAKVRLDTKPNFANVL